MPSTTSERGQHGTGTVSVVVVIDGFHHGGHDYRWRDQLQIPAEHLDLWLGSGYVRLAEQCEHDVRGIVETFLRESDTKSPRGGDDPLRAGDVERG